MKSEVGFLRVKDTDKTSAPLPVPLFRDDDSSVEWEPLLVLARRRVSMQRLGVTVPPSSSTIGWLLSLLVSLFEGVVREFICRQLEEMLQFQTVGLLAAANAAVSAYWPLLLKAINVSCIRVLLGLSS